MASRRMVMLGIITGTPVSSHLVVELKAGKGRVIKALERRSNNLIYTVDDVS